MKILPMQVQDSRGHRAVRTSVLALALLGPATAGAQSGEFTFVTGDVRVTRADRQSVAATRGMQVNPGDTIQTGADGMAQLAMVDQARLSLRANSQLLVQNYPVSRDSSEGAVLNLLRGTLRAFTGLVPAGSRERYAMRTKVATVGIRGSGNILFHCDADCPPNIAGNRPPGDTTLNHTIEGSHNVQALGLNMPPLVSGPGQTVQILPGQPPQFVPTPDVILEAGRIMTAKASTQAGTPPEESRSFSAPDPSAGGTPPPPNTVVGNNGLGFAVTDASGNITGSDPLGIRDIVVASGFTLSSQATAAGLTLDTVTGALRSFNSYAGLQSGVDLRIVNGTLIESRTVSIGAGNSITLGRWSGADVSVLGNTLPGQGGVHFGYGPAGFPAYLSEVLTGEATYALVSATSPSNQNGATGTLGSATVGVNFSARTLNANLAVSLGTGSWSLVASNVPILLNSFFASTDDRLVVSNAAGQNSRNSQAIFGSLEGSFVGSGLNGIVLGYAFGDATNTSASQTISGMAALAGPAQPATAEYRVGLVTDASGVLSGSRFLRNLLVFNRPGEIAQDSITGALRAFSAPAMLPGGYAPYAGYAIGTATLADAGFDPATGLSWGRWAGGIVNVSGTGGNSGINQQGAAGLHYIFASAQSGPVALPLTGSAVYDMVGGSRPTQGNSVGTLNSATLSANFSARTVDFGLNLTNAGQTWTASATGVPIYRDMTFGAYAGTPIPGLPAPAALTLGCTPNCGQGATGAVDGFFTGRSGRGAGMMYNLGGHSGTVAFSRRGG